METTLGLYRTLFNNWRLSAFNIRGRRFPRREHDRDFCRGHLRHRPRQQPRHRFRAEPRRAVNVRFLFVYGTFIVSSLPQGYWPGGRTAYRSRSRPWRCSCWCARCSCAHAHRAVADRSAAAGAVLQFDLLRQRPVLLRPHRPAILAALVFWHIPQWRMFYLAPTAFFGSVVLLGHYHYSIDVLAALFITHGIFQMSCWLFARDYALFRSSEIQIAQRPKRAVRKRIDKWVEGHRRKRPTLVPVDGSEPAPKPFVLHAVGEDPSARDPARPRINDGTAG